MSRNHVLRASDALRRVLLGTCQAALNTHKWEWLFKRGKKTGDTNLRLAGWHLQKGIGWTPTPSGGPNISLAPRVAALLSSEGVGSCCHSIERQVTPISHRMFGNSSTATTANSVSSSAEIAASRVYVEVFGA